MTNLYKVEHIIHSNGDVGFNDRTWAWNKNKQLIDITTSAINGDKNITEFNIKLLYLNPFYIIFIGDYKDVMNCINKHNKMLGFEYSYFSMNEYIVKKLLE
jgi:hypothetical protein